MRYILILCLPALSAFGQQPAPGGLRSPAFVAGLSKSSAVSSPTPEIAWWQLNENTGTTAADSSGNGYTLTLADAAMWTTGKAGSGLAGNGSSYYAQRASVAMGVNIVTVCFWLKDAAFGNNEMVIELGANIAITSPAWYFFEQDSSTLELAQRNTSGILRNETLAPPSTGTWHHYAIVYDNNTPQITIYIDGSAASTTVAGAGVADSANWVTDTVNILARAGASLFSNASIDDIRAYNRDASGDLAAIIADPK